MLDKLHAIESAAKILSVSTHTIRAWYYQGRLRGIKLGSRVLFSEKDLETFIQQGRQRALRP